MTGADDDGDAVVAVVAVGDDDGSDVVVRDGGVAANDGWRLRFLLLTRRFVVRRGW